MGIKTRYQAFAGGVASRKFLIGVLCAGLLLGGGMLGWHMLASSSGSLVLFGGGATNDEEVMNTFWNLAGGKGARILIIPTAHENMDAPETAAERLTYLTSPWRKRGVKSIDIRHTLSREEANRPEFSLPLKNATGIWFGGGDQRRLLDTYRGTRFHTALLAAFRRGAVVGGSSAGTAVQSEFVIVLDDNGEPLLEPGFNLLSGTLLDQHYLAREREPRLQNFIQQHPEIIGLGVDEFTALVVKSGKLSVVGQSTVSVVQASKEAQSLKSWKLQRGDRAQLADLFPRKTTS